MGAKNVCVEIDGVFYKSLKLAGRKTKCEYRAIQKKCLSNDFLNYKIITLKSTEKRCSGCGQVKLLNEFYKNKSKHDGYSPQCILCDLKSGRKHYYNNPEKANQYVLEWRKSNPDLYNKYQKKYSKRRYVMDKANKKQNKRRKTDPIFKLRDTISNAIRASLRDGKCGKPWELLVGYNIEELKIHLEKQFTEGMNWENYGKGKYKWNIDHVIAICHWNITSAECQAFKNCWALGNLQPLWAIRNSEKGNKPMHPKYLIKPDCIK